MKNSTTPIIYPLQDLTVLNEIRRVFFETTGLVLSFHYPGDNQYDFYPKNEKNRYCEAIQSTPEGLQRCLESDNNALCEAKKSGHYCLYTCHAGLMNVVIPLLYKGREIGAIFTGQIFTKEQTEEDFHGIYEKLKPLGLQEHIIFSEFKKVKVFSKDTLLLAIRLINFMANYIISVEDEMFLRSEVHRKEQEILLYENEQMRLKNDLQRLSILVLRDKMDFKSGNDAANPQTQQKQAIIARAQDFIKKNFKEVLTLSDVANAVYLSPNYFST